MSNRTYVLPLAAYKLEMISFLIFNFSFLISFAQPSINSPYSRYGLGDLQNSSFTHNIALGGIYNALQNDTTAPFYINQSNPASHASTRLTVFDFGIKNNTMKLETADNKFTSNRTALAYMALAFPVAKWWGTSIGLLPYSNVGYKIYDKKEQDTIGTVNYAYEGQGGINQAYWGNGIRPFVSLPGKFSGSNRYKRLKALPDSIGGKKVRRTERRRTAFSNLYLGVNFSYLFGDMTYFSRDSFPTSANYQNIKLSKNTRVSDIYSSFGIQYRQSLRKGWSVTLGATGSLNTNIDVRNSIFAANYKNAFGVEVLKDTIIDTIEKSTIKIPMMFGGGIVLKKGDKWLFGFDYSIQDWSQFNSFEQQGLLRNSQKMAAGIQFCPNKSAGSKEPYFKKIFYRVGFRYTNTYLELNNTALKDYAVTFGVGLPLRKMKIIGTTELDAEQKYHQSSMNIGVELGQRGTTENQLIRYSYINAFISLSLNDKWFIKRKYD
jgi:hypothetical protein